MLFDLGFLLLLTAGQALAFSKTDYNYVREVSPTLKIHWKEVSGDDMYLALETKQTKGWTAFGLADPASGSMPGSDIVVALLGNSITLKDTFAMEKMTPVDDTCNDWVLVASETKGSITYVEMKRKIVTKDSQDRPFIVDPKDHNANMAVIFAWGSGGFWYHGSNRIATRINFKQPNKPDPFVALEKDPKIKSFEMRSAWRVKGKDTDYFDLYTGPQYKYKGDAFSAMCPPEKPDPLPDNMYKDPASGRTTRCKDSFVFCDSNLAGCGGDQDGLAQFFGQAGCCAKGSPICPIGNELIPDATYDDETHGTVTCKGAEDYCKANPHMCGDDRNELGAHFASLGCCRKIGSSGEKRCAGGSSRPCEEVKANGLTFECISVGTQSKDSVDVLLLHGFPEYNKHWDPLLNYWEANQKNIYAIACNLRGYSPGANPANAKDYEWDADIEADAWAIADAANFSSFHVVSHDLGAALGWRMGSRKQHKDRILSLTTLSVYHPDAFNKAILEDEAQMVASNYFNQFAEIDSAKKLGAMLGGVPQQQFWWYNTMMGKTITRPEVPSDAVFNKYPKLQMVQGVRAALKISPRAALKATSPTGTIYVPTFMVCGSKDPYLLCDTAIAKGSKDYMASGSEYKHGSFQCAHDLFKEGKTECTSQDEVNKVLTGITEWVLSKQPQGRERRRTASSCDSLPANVKSVCTTAQALGLDTIPLADGVKNLDRTLSVTVGPSAPLSIHSGDVCYPTDCNEYKLPAVAKFEYGTTADETDTAFTRGPKLDVKFSCDAAGDMYTLIFWDALGFVGGPKFRTSKGILHGAWVNIGCDEAKKAVFSTANALYPYSPPANPSAYFANNYGFYLFKQKAKVPLKDGQLAGFDMRVFGAKAMQFGEQGKGLDIATDVLAVFRPFLQPGGPKARTWANVKTSPYSAYSLSRSFPNNGFGQCGGEGKLGGQVDKVKGAWAKYKTADNKCGPPTCSCAAKGKKFCYAYSSAAGCGDCFNYNMEFECEQLPFAAATSCKQQCFGGWATGCRAFDQWLPSKGTNYDYASAIKKVTATEKAVLCEAYRTDTTCQQVITQQKLQASWETMCEPLKGTSAFEILLDLEANPKKVYHMIGFKHIVSPGLEKHIHHMTFEGRLRGEKSYKEFMWVWAIGMHAFLFPEECGVTLGGDGIIALKINFHYDNPAPAVNVGKLDMSGIKVFYTDQLRKNECGSIAFGDPNIRLLGRALPKGDSASVFTCPAECTKKFFPNGATLFASFLHQHQHGRRIWTDQRRNGALVNTDRNDFWDHNFQLTIPVSGKAQPGDTFTTTCINRSPDGKVIWGLASDQEMCINYLYYWPKVYDEGSYCGYKACGSMLPVKPITGDKPVSFGMEVSSDSCPKVDDTKKPDDTKKDDGVDKPTPKKPPTFVEVRDAVATGSVFPFTAAVVVAIMMMM